MLCQGVQVTIKSSQFFIFQSYLGGELELFWEQ